MGFLNPDVTNNGGVVAPVVDSSMSNLSGLGSLLGSMGPKATSAPTATSLKGQAELKYYSDMAAAREMGNNNPAQSLVMAQDAMRSYSSVVGESDEAANTFFTNQTGQSYFGAQGSTLFDMGDLVGTPEYEGNLELIYLEQPDISQAAAHNQAVTTTITNKGLQQQVSNAQIDKAASWFTRDSVTGATTEEAFAKTASQALTLGKSLIASAQVDRIVTPEEAEAIRAFFQQSFWGVPKPLGATAEQWKNHQDTYVLPAQKLVNGIIDMTGQDGYNDMQNALGQIFGLAVEQGKISPTVSMKFDNSDGTYAAALQIISNIAAGTEDNRFLANYKLLLDMTFDEMTTWVREFDVMTVADLDNIQLEGNLEEFKSMGATEQMNTLRADVAMLTNQPPKDVAVDLVSLTERLSATTSTAMQPQDYKFFYGNTTTAALNLVATENPVIASHLATKLGNSIVAQEAKTVLKFQSVLAQSPYEVVDGVITLTDGQQIEAPLTFSTDAAIGAAMVNTAEARRREDERLKLTSLLGEIEAIAKVKEDFYSGLDFLKESPTEVIPADDISTGYQAAADIISKWEGTDNSYDKLFFDGETGSKPFNGMRVSEMTIGELKEFSDPNGQYGKWVKENNKGVLSTPMGKYQFIGSTLKEVATQMGLSDETVFTPEVQDAMFAHRFQWRLNRSSTKEGQVQNLRNEWDSLNKASDAEVVLLIEAFERGTPITLTELEAPTPGILEGAGAVRSGVTGSPERRPQPSTPVRREEYKSFTTEEEAKSAFNRGEIAVGDRVYISGVLSEAKDDDGDGVLD